MQGHSAQHLVDEDGAGDAAAAGDALRRQRAVVVDHQHLHLRGRSGAGGRHGRAWVKVEILVQLRLGQGGAAPTSTKLGFI